MATGANGFWRACLASTGRFWSGSFFKHFGHSDAGGAGIVFHEALEVFFRSILETYISDPLLYLGVLFIYGVATAIFLPIPVEIALFVKPPDLSIFLIAFVIGLSKMVGAGLVFLLGLRVEGPIRYYSARYRRIGQFVGYVTRFVRLTGWVGLFVLISIPGLPDTLPIYLYSLFNKQGQLIRGWVFLLVNFVGGILRALIFFFFFAVLGF